MKIKPILSLLSLFILLVFSLQSCKKEASKDVSKVNHAQKTSGKKSDSLDSKILELQSFGFPQEVEGCSCYFAKNREEFIKQNYIYVDDFQRFSFLTINGELVKIPYGKQNEVLPEKNLNIESKNKEYSVKIKGKLIEQGEIETALYEGILEVTKSDGSKVSSKIYGECGC